VTFSDTIRDEPTVQSWTKEVNAVTDPGSITPDETFDDLARSLAEEKPSRRKVLALAGTSLVSSTLVALGLREDAEAKKRKKKKKKKKKKPPPPAPIPAPLGAVTSCQNIGFPCGLGAQTAICQCRFNKEGTGSCVNVGTPPNGITFVPCQQSINCVGGPPQVCDAQASVCALTCQNA
jgi:hypothetical protein